MIGGSAKIGEIYGELRIKLDKLKKDLGDSFRQTENFRNKAGKAFNQFAGIIAGAFTVASAAIIKTTKDTVIFAERMRGFAKATNMSVEDVQEFAYAAEQEHASMESFSRGVKNLTIRMDYAGKGMETYIKYFRELGINYQNTDGSLRNVKDVFLDLSDSISHGTLTTEKQAAALQLLGARAGQELIPTLKKGKKWFGEMADEARRMGYVMKEEDIEAVKSFDDKFLALKSSFNATKREFVLGMLPTLDSLAQKLKDNGEEAQAFRVSMRNIGESVGVATNKLIEWGGKFTNWWGGIWEKLGEKAVRDQIAKLELEIQKYYDMAAAGEITAREAGKAINYLKRQIKFLDESLQEGTKEVENFKAAVEEVSTAPKIEFFEEEDKKAIEEKKRLEQEAWNAEAEMFSEKAKLQQEMHEWAVQYKKDHAEMKIDTEEVAEAVGELMGTFVQSGGDALAILKKIIGQQIRLQLLSKLGIGGSLLSGIMQVFGFQEGGVIPRGMPVLNMAMYNENPRRPETAFGSPGGDKTVVPWDKLPQMVKVETYVTNANPDTQVRTFIKANPDAMDEFWRYGVRPAMIRDRKR